MSKTKQDAYIRSVRRKYLVNFRFRLCWKSDYILNFRGSDYRCSNCPRSFVRKRIAERHLKACLKRNKFKCLFCSYRGDSYPDLVDHSKEHVDEQPYKCVHCDKSFVSLQGLTSHERVHLPKNLFLPENQLCFTCGKSFTKRSDLMRHLETHRKKYPCHICSNFFSHKGLRNHRKLNKAIFLKDHCTACNLEIRSVCLYMKDMATHSLVGNLEELGPDKMVDFIESMPIDSLYCLICSYRCDSKISLLKHTEEHMILEGDAATCDLFDIPSFISSYQQTSVCEDESHSQGLQTIYEIPEDHSYSMPSNNPVGDMLGEDSGNRGMTSPQSHLLDSAFLDVLPHSIFSSLMENRHQGGAFKDGKLEKSRYKKCTSKPKKENRNVSDLGQVKCKVDNVNLSPRKESSFAIDSGKLNCEKNIFSLSHKLLVNDFNRVNCKSVMDKVSPRKENTLVCNSNQSPVVEKTSSIHNHLSSQDGEVPADGESSQIGFMSKVHISGSDTKEKTSSCNNTYTTSISTSLSTVDSSAQQDLSLRKLSVLHSLNVVPKKKKKKKKRRKRNVLSIGVLDKKRKCLKCGKLYTGRKYNHWFRCPAVVASNSSVHDNTASPLSPMISSAKEEDLNSGFPVQTSQIQEKTDVIAKRIQENADVVIAKRIQENVDIGIPKKMQETDVGIPKRIQENTDVGIPKRIKEETDVVIARNIHEKIDVRIAKRNPMPPKKKWKRRSGLSSKVSPWRRCSSCGILCYGKMTNHWLKYHADDPNNTVVGGSTNLPPSIDRPHISGGVKASNHVEAAKMSSRKRPRTGNHGVEKGNVRKSKSATPETLKMDRGKQNPSRPSKNIGEKLDKKDRPYCPLCGKLFLFRNTFEKHRQLHEKAGWFVCYTCGNVYRSKINLDHHCQMKHPLSVMNVRRELKVSVSPENVKELLPTKNRAKVKEAEAKILSCSTCRMQIYGEDALKRHISLHKDNRYVCMHCGKEFVSNRNVDRHVARSHRGQKWKALQDCYICGGTFHAELFPKHLELHTEAGWIICIKCGLIYKNHRGLGLHELRFHNRIKVVKCVSCLKTFRSLTDLESHLRHSVCDGTKPNDNPLSKRCIKDEPSGPRKSHVGVPESTKLDMKAKAEDNISHRYVCSICGRNFTNAMGLAVHRRRAHVEQNALKKSPGKRDSVKNIPSGPRNVHAGVPESNRRKVDLNVKAKAEDKISLRYVCSICGRNFTNATGLAVHRRRAHIEHNALKKSPGKRDSVKNIPSGPRNVHAGVPESNRCKVDLNVKAKDKIRSNIDLNVKVENKISENYVCSTCGKVYLSSGGLRKHSKIYHKDQNRLKKTPDKRNSVTSSDKQTQVQAQMGVPEGKVYKCPACRRSFDNRDAFAKHVVIHERSKWYICVDCSLCFWLKEGLKEHSLSSHSEYYTTEKNTKEMKISDIETEEEPNSSDIAIDNQQTVDCYVCGKKGMNFRSFKVHVEKHEKDHWYICEHCGNCYRDKINLSNHKGRYHAKIKKVKIALTSPTKVESPKPINGLTQDMKVDSQALTKTLTLEANTCTDNLDTESDVQIKTDIKIKVERMLPCDKCGKFYGTTEKEFVEHVESHKRSEKPLESPVCQESLNQEGQLLLEAKVHSKHKDEEMERTSVAEMNCYKCKKVFAFKMCFEEHLKRCNGERLASHKRKHIALSSQNFQRVRMLSIKAKALTSNRKVLSPQKKKRCNLCERAFYFSATLRYHVMRDHPSIGSNPSRPSADKYNPSRGPSTDEAKETNDTHSKAKCESVDEASQSKADEDKVIHSKTIGDEPVHNKSIGDEPIHSKAIGGEPIHSNAIVDEPIHSKAIEDEPIHSKAIEDEPIHSKAIRDEIIHSKAIGNEAIHSKAVGGKVILSKTFWDEPSHSKPIGDEPIHSKAIEDEPIQSQAIGDEPIHSKAIGDEPIHSKAIGDEPIHIKAIGDEIIHSKASGNEAIHSKAVGGKVILSKTIWDKPLHSKAIGDEPIHSKAIGDEQIQSMAIGDEPIHSKAIWDEPIHSKAIWDDPIHSKAIGDEIFHSKAIGDEPIHNKSFDDEPIHCKAIGDEPIHCKAIGDEPIHSKVIGDESIHSKAIWDAPIHSKTIGDEIVHSKAIGNEAIHNKAVGGKVILSKTIGDEPIHSKAIGGEPIHIKAIGDEHIYSKAIEDEPSHSKAIRDEPSHSKTIGDEPIHIKAIGDEPIYSKAIGEEPIHSKAIGDEPIQSMAIGDEPIQSMAIGDEPIHSKAIVDEPIHSKAIWVEDCHRKSIGGKTIHSKGIGSKIIHSQTFGDEAIDSKANWDETIQNKVIEVEVIHSIAIGDEIIYSKTTGDEPIYCKANGDEAIHSQAIGDEAIHSNTIGVEAIHSKANEDKAIDCKTNGNKAIHGKAVGDDAIHRKAIEDEAIQNTT